MRTQCLITPFCEVGPSQGVHFRSKCYISKLPEKSGLQLSPPMQEIGGPVLEIIGGLGCGVNQLQGGLLCASAFWCEIQRFCGFHLMRGTWEVL